MNETCTACNKIPTKFYREFCGTCYNKFLSEGKIPRKNDKLPEIEEALTLEQEKILIGLMLGDGHLKKIKKNHNSCLTITRSLKDKEYLLENYRTFKNFCSNKAVRIKNTVTAELAFQGIKEPKDYVAITLETRKCKQFTVQRKYWYPKGTKIIPRSLKSLDPLSIAIWLADDGCIQEYRDDKLSVIFYTNGFLKKDVMYLISLLEKRYEKGFILKPRDLEKQQFIIICYDKLARKLLNDIDPYFPKSMARKSDIWQKVNAFYDDNYVASKPIHLKINKRYENALKSLDFFKENNIKEFNIKTFALKAKLVRKNGTTYTNQAKTYINKLLKEGLIEQVNQSDNKYSEKFYSIKKL